MAIQCQCLVDRALAVLPLATPERQSCVPATTVRTATTLTKRLKEIHGDEGREERRGRLSWATSFSGSMSHCTRRGCQVGGRSKYCCFHPICRTRRKRQCSWLQYFSGKLSLGVSSENCRPILPPSWSDCSRRMDLRETANPNSRDTRP